MTVATGTGADTRILGLSSRKDIYLLLAQGFSFPDLDLFNAVARGQWEQSLSVALAQLPCRFRTSGVSWSPGPDYDQLQSEYIRLFQVGGRRGPPCPLHEGHYTRDRGRTLQDLVRFYNFFGFRTIECVMPDHLPVQLEFMSELADAGSARERTGTLLAQRDFLRGHLVWLQQLNDRVAAAGPLPFYRSLATLASRFATADERLITTALGEDPHG
jgi:DMSO reductase family type II enzyme chaperone